MRPANIEAERLRDLCWSANLTRSRIASILRVSRSTVQSWLRGDDDGVSAIPFAHFMILVLYIAWREQDDNTVNATLREVAEGDDE